jgi:queuosine precursor transporter
MIDKKAIHQYSQFTFDRLLIFLSMLYVVIVILPAPFLYRLIQVKVLTLPGGMFIFPLIYVVGDIIAELYGYKTIRSLIWYSLICNFIFAAAVQSIIYLPYPKGNALVSHDYVVVFHGLIRGDFANIIGVICGRFINAYILTKAKFILKGKYFFFRTFFSNVIGELVMLVLWVNLAYAGKYPYHMIVHIAASDYFVRVAYALVAAIPATLLVKWLKQYHKVDIYDGNTQFNPFKLN